MRRLVLAALLVAPLTALAQPAPPESGIVAVPGFPAAGLPGLAAGNEHGQSVAAAGDVNGDGYDDLVVGAPFHPVAGVGVAGAAFVYFGGPGADAVPDLTLTGAGANDQFGASVAGAGDVNGDGFDDVIVGALTNDAGGANAGRAYVFFGGLTPNTAPDLVLTGAEAGDLFGRSVAGAGDVNGDGVDDVIVGAYNNDAGGSNAGRAYVFFGGPGIDAAPDLTVTGAAANDFFGFAVAGAGDVNGDGYDDLVVGAYLNDAGGTSAGRAYVFFGGAAPDATPDLVLTGEAAADQFGISVAGAGDVNGDGYDDVLVGATGNDAGASNAGAASVFFGGAAPDAAADLTVIGSAASDQMGRSVGGAGDVNGDGFDDLIVGAYLNDAGGASAGRAYVVFGGTAPDGVPDVILTGAAAGDLFGYAVAGAGDLDGDGLPDLVVGAPARTTANGTGSGAAYVYSNANTGAGVALWSALGAAANDRFGQSVAAAGDVNGDGYGDLIVGAWLNDAGGADTGRAYLYFGGPGADATPDLTLTGAASGDRFGRSVAGAGDVNGDGYDDLIVGAYVNDAGGTDTGRAYIYFGGAAPDATPDLTLTGAAVDDQFGIAVAGAGDVNGDGYADVIVGAWLNDAGGTNAGRAYVFFGGATPDATPDLVLTGAAAGDTFGYSVASAGDVNGDGYADVIIGAVFNSAGGVGAGQAYVYFGGLAPDAVADLTLTGQAAGDNFGQVAGAGDVNGDGYDDLLVGADSNAAGGFNAGRAYVYFGGPNADAIPDLTLTGANSGDSFGESVAGAGDVNADGFADVIVGATGNNAAGIDAGQAYVYFGGPAPDATPDLTLTGAATGDTFGNSVTGAGDVTGDGRADLLVGSPLNDLAGSSAGAAYLYSATGPAASPGFTRLADEPGDQGGWLDARWMRSGSEMTGAVTGYLVERSHPAGSGGFAWAPVTTVPATGNTRYSLAVPTYSDQTGTNPGITCVRVTALGADGELWRSTVRCAASIDNLAPGAPPALTVTGSPDGDALVGVTPLTAPPPDLAGYAVFRSADDICDPADPLVGLATDLLAPSLEDDATDFGTDVWYCTAARDVHGNDSPRVGPATANPAVLAAVKVVLQGAYAPGLPGGALMRADLEDVLPLAQPYGSAPWNYAGSEAIPATDVSPANGRPDLLDAYDVVDWVLVEVRPTPTAPTTLRAAALLLADGTLLDPTSGLAAARARPAAPGAYYVVVYHRSHLAAMSVFAIGLSTTPTAAFDFTLSSSLAYGTGGVGLLAPGLYGVWAGDADGDGVVDVSDRTTVWRPQAGGEGYLSGDLDLDGAVLADDRQRLWLPNVGRTTQVPGASLAPVTADR